MSLSSTSLAAAVGASVKNVQFQPTADTLPHKMAVVGTYDPSKTTVVDEEKILLLSPEDAGDKFGFGFMLHRLCMAAAKGSNGVEMWAIPQSEISGAQQSDGEIIVAVDGTVGAGTLALYIAGDYVPVVVPAGSSAAAIAALVKSAIDGYEGDILMVTAGTVSTSTIPVTSKSAGPWGDAITLAVNLNAGDKYPTGVSVTFTAMSGGAGTPDIAPALAALGSGDDANEDWFTELVHGYGMVTDVLDDISAYVGAGNEYIGLYDKLVSRPLVSLCGNVATGSAGLQALIAVTDLRLEDRANGVVCVPGSQTHPAEIAALALGIRARTNNDVAAESYIGKMLPGVLPGLNLSTSRWTSDYDSRDTAVKNGISPTRVRNGVVYLQNVVTFYRPASIPVSSNGYRSMRNISILQNVLYNIRRNFEQEKWLGYFIVEDVDNVGSTVDRQKARDIDAVINDLMALAYAFENKGWIYTASFTIDRLKQAGAVSIRSGTTGFDAYFPIILSGEGAILDIMTLFDTSIAALQ